MGLKKMDEEFLASSEELEEDNLDEAIDDLELDEI